MDKQEAGPPPQEAKMGCKTRKYSDGGKVMEREYGGNPTYAKALLGRVGIGDGYGNAKNPPKPANRMNVGNAASTIGSVVAKRKKMLDET